MPDIPISDNEREKVKPNNDPPNDDPNEDLNRNDKFSKRIANQTYQITFIF